MFLAEEIVKLIIEEGKNYGTHPDEVARIYSFFLCVSNELIKEMKKIRKEERKKGKNVMNINSKDKYVTNGKNKRVCVESNEGFA